MSENIIKYTKTEHYTIFYNKEWKMFFSTIPSLKDKVYPTAAEAIEASENELSR